MRLLFGNWGNKPRVIFWQLWDQWDWGYYITSFMNHTLEQVMDERELTQGLNYVILITSRYLHCVESAASETPHSRERRRRWCSALYIMYIMDITTARQNTVKL